MARLNGDPPRHGWTRAGVRFGLALLLALWATGVLLELWPAEAVFQLAAWQAGLRHAALVLHGIGAWLACVALGRWIWPHAAIAWRMPTGRTWWLGLVGATMASAVAITGLALLYGPADWHEGLGQVHWWIGVGWPALVLWHAVRLLRRAAAAAR